MAKANKVLVDTSLVPAAMKASTPDHCKEFRNTVGDANLFSSVYIRNEFLKRWVCSMIRFAHIASQCSSVKQFWFYVGQDYGGRNLKTHTFAMGLAAKSIGAAESPNELAEEFVHIVQGLVKKFDRVFNSMINNSCGCQIGGLPLKVDVDEWKVDTGAFYEKVMAKIEDCDVNRFVNLGAPVSNASKLLKDARSKKVVAAENMREIQNAGAKITCTNCRKVGDVVIALEQPGPFILVHGDNGSYPALCAIRGRREMYVESVQSLEHADPDWKWTLQSSGPRET